MPPNRGRVAVLAGPDASGKTTIGSVLTGTLPGRVDIMWQRPTVLPRKTRRSSVGPELPHGMSLYPVWLSIVKVLYVFLDMVLGWAVRVLPLVRSGGYVLIERSWWDMEVDPTRYRLQGVSGLVRVLGRLVPRPDVVLLLQGPPEVLHARRPELPPEELSRQMEAWERVLPPGVRRVPLDVGASLDRTVAQAADAILAGTG